MPLETERETADKQTPVLLVEDLQQRLRDPQTGEQFVVTLEGRLAIPPGAFAAMLGPSGCGKSTLLSVFGLLRRPSHPHEIGRFEIAGIDADGAVRVHDLKALWRSNQQGQIERLRRQNIGFALQSGELLSSLTVRENIAVPLRLNGIGRRQVNGRVDELLASFGLDASSDLESENGDQRKNRLAHARVNKLSGGEYQRVVLARAIAHQPRIVFVDEPTSALNRELARKSLIQLKLSQLTGDNPGAVVMITHDEELAAEFADMVIRMEPEPGKAAGRVVEIASTTPTYDAAAFLR
ncbi:ABC transporter ATP-binding protein [Blastopirellula marina]|nr:ATP-binding cassette domain-containing protein [Blastopirellula marina]